MSYPKYVSIDIETTGLDPQTCQILEIGMVVEDWQTPIEDLPCLTFLVDPGIIVGEPYALQMNSQVLLDIYDLRGCRATSRRGCGDISTTELAVDEMVAFLASTSHRRLERSISRPPVRTSRGSTAGSSNASHTGGTAYRPATGRSTQGRCTSTRRLTTGFPARPSACVGQAWTPT